MNNEYERDGFTCPYCGDYEPCEVGMGTPHTCPGTIQAHSKQEELRRLYEQQRAELEAERRQQARFLMRSGLLTYPEAYWLANPLLDDDNDYGGPF